METVLRSKTCGKRTALLPKIQFISARMKIDRPIVAMMTEITGSPTSGRSSSTCTRMPNSVMKTREKMKASQKGRPRETTRARHTQAPRTTNSPCAKFTTWVDL